MVINVDDDDDDDGDDDDGDDGDGDGDDDDDGGDDEYEDGDGDDEDGSDEEGENGDGEDAGDGDDADDDDEEEEEEEEEEERKRMMLMLMFMLRRRRRRRKMMMLRRRMLRRKTDPKTGKHTSCEPVQPKCRRTLHKSQSVWKIRGKMAADTSRFVRACAVKMHMDKVQQPFCTENLHEKRPGTPPGTSFCASLRRRNAHGHVTRGILCGNLQGKCRTRTVLREPAQSKCTWTCHKRHFVRKFTSDTTSIEHRAWTVTVRTPQCGHTAWGK